MGVIQSMGVGSVSAVAPEPGYCQQHIQMDDSVQAAFAVAIADSALTAGKLGEFKFCGVLLVP